MPNPLIAQGTLNRLRGSIVIPDVPNLNVTAPYLGKAGISLQLTGEATTNIPTLTGVVQSAEPYMPCSISVPLLRTQPLANLYKRRMEFLSIIGPVTIRSDASQFEPYQFINCSIASVDAQGYGGDNPHLPVIITGYYNINSGLWDA